jgi:Protein of unknown function (DUF3224)
MAKTKGPEHVTVGSTVVVAKYERVELNRVDESGMTVVETRLEEHFTGGMVGQGIATHLRIEREDRTGELICYERFTGTLGGAEGSFLLQASGFADRHHYVHGQWSIVEGSGTRALSGIRGYAAFVASPAADTPTGWQAETSLTYWFDV